ncbi:CAP domain-containing protein [Streptantibioticus parmotrematis]|uniref:CAP domain-containing protein n=1 Tax=Streptantibioticus parmotrematis TaxID=2873249 RepID=UPI0033F72191
MTSDPRVGSPTGQPARHRARRAPRTRIVLAGAAAVAALGGGTAFACMGGSSGGHPAAAHRPDPAVHLIPASSAPSAPPAQISATRRPTAHPAPTHHRTTPTAAPTHTPTTRPAPVNSPTTGGGSGSGGSGATANGEAVQQVLALINKARAAQGLAPYTLLSGLSRAAAAHNQVMADGCGLSHQCPGEPPFYERDRAQGVPSGAGGENIGEGGPMDDTQQAIASMAVNLTQGMLNEQPPDDGHRRNILSSTYTHVGIAVLRDSSGTVWMTQDFSQ